MHLHRDCATDFVAGVLPVPPTAFWSIFALLSVDNPRRDTDALSWIRRSIIAAVAGALADAYSADSTPAHIEDTLRHALVRLDDDARTGRPWARNAGRASALLAFFDSESRVLRVVNTGPGRAYLGRRVRGAADYECIELLGPGSPRYVEPARTRRVDVEDLVDEGVFDPRGTLDVASVQTCSIEVHDGDFLVLGSESTWAGLEGSEAVQAVSMCIREQDMPVPEGRFRTLDPVLGLDIPWKDEDGLGLGWVGAMIPAMMRDFNDMFSRPRGNPAGCVLRRIERRAESGGAPGHDDHAGKHPVRPTSSSG